MAIELYLKRLKMFETVLLSDQTDFSGVEFLTFKAITGSRLLLFLNVRAITGTPTINMVVENGVEIGEEFKELSNTNQTAPGIYSFAFSDIHIYFNISITVTGGTATYTLGATLADNKSDAVSVIGDVNVIVDGLDPTDPSTIVVVGTEDGEADGIKRIWVNNRRQQIVSAHDVDAAYVWADFGNTKERVLSITYTSPTFPGESAIRTFTYAVVGGKYRLDSDEWSII